MILLLNLNSFHFHGGRIQALTSGIMSLLYGQPPPALPAMHHPILYPATLVILIVTGLLLLWMAWMVRAWRRWQRQPACRPQGRRKLGALYAPLLLPLGWALLLWIGIPQALYPLAVLRINIPDFGYTVLASGLLALGWSLLWLGLLVFARPAEVASPALHTTIETNLVKAYLNCLAQTH